MSFDALSVAVLTAISSWLGVESLPRGEHSHWSVSQAWGETQGGYGMEARSSTLSEYCRENPGHMIEFPPVIHGVHEVRLDGVMIARYGTPGFDPVRSFYGSPVLSCGQVITGRELVWRVWSYSRYFARIRAFPAVVSHASFRNVFSETMNAVAAGGLMLLFLFTSLIFWGRVSRDLTLSIALASLCFSTYFLGATAGFFGIPGSMLVVHKVADLGVWTGGALFFNALRLTGIIGPRIYFAYLGNLVLACTVIVFGSTGDVVQFGTTLPFGFTLFINIVCAFRLFRNLYRRGITRTGLFAGISLSVFLAASVNDIGVVTGLSGGYTMFHFGVVGGLLFFALHVNEQIGETYKERDLLRGNLEEQVEEKTHALTQTLATLKRTQADLVQNEKLASLGTLSAGIAHEINNSLNYVSGAVAPIRKIADGMEEGDKKARILRLTGVMQDGLKLTFDIIRSLRNYTALNQAKLDDVRLKDLAESVILLVRGRLGATVSTRVEVEPEVCVQANVIGLNQVLTNLITNAADAMQDGGEITIAARNDGEFVVLEVADTGSGVPQEIRSRIFDPFFTTKDVGKGTGLGLYLTKREVERHRGTISIASEAGKGTRFTIRLPRIFQGEHEPGVAA